MNAAHVNIPNNATVLTEQEECVVKTTRTINRKGTIEMKQLDAINMRIASKPIIECLIEKGLIYKDENETLHVFEQKNIPTQTAKS